MLRVDIETNTEEFPQYLPSGESIENALIRFFRDEFGLYPTKINWMGVNEDNFVYDEQTLYCLPASFMEDTDASDKEFEDDFIPF